MIGTQIGQLAIIRQIGQGAMGAVYLAQHKVLSTLSVVKVLLPQWSQDQSMVQRFINEAKAASSIQHASIIEVGDCGQLADGTWYIVMKYLDGGTLDVFLRSQGGPISMHLALQILATAADGLEAAHARQIVHCDLKPENIFLVHRGANAHHSVILDFGVAHMTEQLSGLRTAPGMIAGTLAYMAPEQIFDRRTVDRRSDVYALGVIAYQMVTGGWLPFQRPEAPGAFLELAPAAIYELQRTTAPIDPRTRGAAISDGFAGAILAALQFDPSRRPQSPRAFLLLLASAVAADSYLPSGVEILQDYAASLLDIGNLGETVRGPRPPVRSAAKRYQIGEQLGEGGMAEVYRAVVTGTEGFARPVAIKRIRSAFSSDPNFARMFVQEAKLVAQLAHPNIVTVLDFDRDEENRLFLALEYVDGVDLHRLMGMGTGPIPHDVVIFLLSEILSGLGHAHNLQSDGPVLGMVHRDLSPHNVLLSWAGAVKVADFGLAKPRDSSEASASVLLKGKVAYMSPEQANGNSLDGRSDLFSVGIVAWDLLTGEQLFAHEDYKSTLARVLMRPIPRPSTIRHVPPDLEAVVMKLLDRDPLARYATAELAIEALAACAQATLGGRNKLAQLLSERFPPASRVSSPRAATNAPASPVLPPAPPSPVAPIFTPPVAPVSTPPPVAPLATPPPQYATTPTSVSMVASESVPRAAPTRTRRSLLITITGSVAAVVATVAIVGSRVHRDPRPAAIATSPKPAALAVPASLDRAAVLDAGVREEIAPVLTTTLPVHAGAVSPLPPAPLAPSAPAAPAVVRTSVLVHAGSGAPAPASGAQPAPSTEHPSKSKPVRRGTEQPDADEVGGD